MPSIAIYGIGNVLIGDDAIGPTVVRHLEALYEFPPNVILEDLGTPSLDLAGRLAGTDIVLFVDAVSAKGTPGEIRTYTRAEILKHPPSLRISPHDPSLKETLLTLELLPDAPREVKLIGVIPASLQQFGLTPEVRNAIPAAMEAVLAELARFGVQPVPRTAAAVPPAFWEAA
ncbi:MAG TPA: hydrogenase maturation protease [Thermoanaerobaculia bacterium]|nr:hydrogenase maturation protease [Thermoanaerobaculia bacterium]